MFSINNIIYQKIDQNIDLLLKCKQSESWQILQKSCRHAKAEFGEICGKFNSRRACVASNAGSDMLSLIN